MTITTAKAWLESKIADPRKHMDKALVISGPKGNGKGIASRLVAQRFRNCSFGKLEPILKFYGSYMEQNEIIIIDEDIDYHRNLDIFKKLISSERIDIEPKANEKYTIRNTTGFIFLTSDENLFKEDDRLFINTNPIQVMAIMSNIPIY